MKKNYLKMGAALFTIFVGEKSYAADNDAKLITNDAGIVAARRLLTMGADGLIATDKETKETSATKIPAQVSGPVYDPVKRLIYIGLNKTKDPVFCAPIELIRTSEDSRYTHVLHVGIRKSTEGSLPDMTLSVPFNTHAANLPPQFTATISGDRFITIGNATP
jgi:hypothetical protein